MILLKIRSTLILYSFTVSILLGMFQCLEFQHLHWDIEYLYKPKGTTHCIHSNDTRIVMLIYSISFSTQHQRSVINIASAIVTIDLVMRKPAFCICENKDADQLRPSTF